MNISFANSTQLNFQLGPQWKCEKRRTENICKQAGDKSKVIIWTAKKIGASDSLDQYFDHLKQPKTLKNNLTSTPEYAKIVDINGQKWVDALHWQSEVPNYFTRYLATVNEKNGVLITFSARKSEFENFNKEVQTTVDQLKLF